MNISRREALILLSGATFGADMAWTSHWPYSRSEISSQSIQLVKNEGCKIEKAIHFSGFNREFAHQGRKVVYTPNPRSVAETLLQIGYIDGGEDTVRKLITFVSDRGLQISCTDLMTAGGRFNGFAAYFKQPEIHIDSFLFNNGYPNRIIDQTLWHEFYHLVQVARNPIERTGMLGADLGSVLLPTYFSYKGVKNFLSIIGSRRDSIKSTLIAGIISIGTAQGAIVGLKASETQAYAEIERLKQESSMKNRVGTLFTIQDSSRS